MIVRDDINDYPSTFLIGYRIEGKPQVRSMTRPKEAIDSMKQLKRRGAADTCIVAIRSIHGQMDDIYSNIKGLGRILAEMDDGSAPTATNYLVCDEGSKEVSGHPSLAQAVSRRDELQARGRPTRILGLETFDGDEAESLPDIIELWRSMLIDEDDAFEDDDD